ncbi:putative nuclease HARBI1 [Prorops nasuta]|uniref:putative nuclease HARBI1 n=1 Tax=Prorops nasuta TaxID=863751 RepID=UPI0034D00CAE
MDNRDILKILLKPTLDTSASSDTSSNNTSLGISSDTTYISCEDENEEEMKILFPLYRILIEVERRNHIECYLHIIENYTENEFKKHFRLSRTIVQQIISDLESSNIIPSYSFGPKYISAKLSFLLFLWFISNTEPLRTLADRFNISISSVFRVVRRVAKFLVEKSNEIISWPKTNELIAHISDNFQQKRGIPKVIGAIDSTYIAIKRPQERCNEYCNRKKFFSINLMAVVDADMKFIYVYCGEAETLHDARVLRRSNLYNVAEESTSLLFPNETFIIGDAAYPSLSWLVPPFKDNGHLSQHQQEFNYMLSSTRMVVERAFGYLKGRFRRLKFFSEYSDIDFVTDITIAACVLHNICISSNEDLNNIEINYNEDNASAEAGATNENNRCGRRENLFRELFAQ